MNALRIRTWVAIVSVAMTGFVGFATEASAQVVSAAAYYERGVLMVRGKTRHGGQYVELERFAVVRSDRFGHFVFRQIVTPRDCTVDLRAARQRFLARIRNCPVQPSPRSSASSGMRIDVARYEAGVLRVSGTTREAFQTITLDGRFRERSNWHGKFRFRVAYKPFDCRARLRSGETILHTRIEGCAARQR